AHGNTGLGHVLLGLADRIRSEMEDRGGEHGAGVSFGDAVDEMVERADAARGDDRYGHRIGDGSRQFEVQARFGAMAVHGREQDLPGADRRHFLRVFDGVDARPVAPPMREDLPAGWLAGGRYALRVDGDDDALRAELLRRLFDEL